MRSTIHVLEVSPVAELFLGGGGRGREKKYSVQWVYIFHIFKPCLYQPLFVCLFVSFPLFSKKLIFLSHDSEHLAALRLNREIDDTFGARGTEKYQKLG